MTANVVKKPRIVLYGIGQYGGYIARFAVEKGWPIVAAFNRSGPKIGKDLGRVIGLDRDIGVVIQDCDTASYDNLEADIGVVVLTNRLSMNMPAYKRLLNAGLNVICHGGESYCPHINNAELAAEIDALAKRNEVTFTGSGIWDMSRIWAGILVTGPCTEIRSLLHRSYTDISKQANSREQAMLGAGTGLTVEEWEAADIRNNAVADTYRTIPEQVLIALGYTLTGSKGFSEPIVFDIPIDNPVVGLVPAGHCVGMRTIIETKTAEGVTARAEIELRLFKEGETEDMFWSVDGKPRTSIRTERLDSAHATASCLFNRIPDVIAAPPGIVTISQMGPLKHTALV